MPHCRSLAEPSLPCSRVAFAKDAQYGAATCQACSKAGFKVDTHSGCKAAIACAATGST
jgi:hypothetical protein